MNNFFLLNEAIDIADFGDFREGMSELAAIKRIKDDVFMKHSSVYNVPSYGELFSNYGQIEQTIIQFIEQLKGHDHYLSTETIFRTYFTQGKNAFLGIDFADTGIETSIQIINEKTYLKFNDDNLWDVSFRNLWSKKDKLFPNLILCGEVENQIIDIGDSGHFNQIVDRLTEFDKAVGLWSKGDFNYRQINREYNLRISPETDQTMRSYGNERIFRMPEGGTNIFEFHIKTGDLRFHFYPDNKTRKLYIGYIGPHLTTVSN